MNVNPKKVKVSGLPSPRRWRRTAAWRPNSAGASSPHLISEKPQQAHLVSQ
jgi:hypothetical protein